MIVVFDFPFITAYSTLGFFGSTCETVGKITVYDLENKDLIRSRWCQQYRLTPRCWFMPSLNACHSEVIWTSSSISTEYSHKCKQPRLGHWESWIARFSTFVGMPNARFVRPLLNKKWSYFIILCQPWGSFMRFANTGKIRRRWRNRIFRRVFWFWLHLSFICRSIAVKGITFCPSPRHTEMQCNLLHSSQFVTGFCPASDLVQFSDETGKIKLTTE